MGKVSINLWSKDHKGMNIEERVSSTLGESLKEE